MIGLTRWLSLRHVSRPFAPLVPYVYFNFNFNIQVGYQNDCVYIWTVYCVYMQWVASTSPARFL